MSRTVFGRVYELCLRGQAPGEHPYVGMTTGTIHQRVHGKQDSAHTSRQSVRRDPWKARILPGAAGYRQLEVVYATGDPAEDDRTLRRAEAFWIDRLRTTYNDVRPVRPFRDQPQPARRSPRPATRQTRRRARRRVPWRAMLCVVFMVVATVLASRVIVAMELPWPMAPWIASPVLGTAAGWALFWRAHKAVRKLLR